MANYSPAILAAIHCATSFAEYGLAHCKQDLTACLASKGVHCATGLWHVLNSS